VEVGLEAVAEAAPDASLGSEVIDDIHLLDQVVKRIGGDVAFLQVECGPTGEIGDVSLLEGARVEVGETVDADYLDVCFEEPFREPASKESGAASHKRAISATPEVGVYV
jgi:hypothetical protein